MDQDGLESIDADTNDRISGLSREEASIHPQLSAFMPNPISPPGLGDLEALERLKNAIKNNQHELFRAVPRPAVLASLWQGPATTGSDSDGPVSQPTERQLDSSSELAGSRNESRNGSIGAPVFPQNATFLGTRDPSVASVPNGSSGHQVEPITLSTDSPNEAISHAAITHSEAVEDVKPEMSVEPLTPLTQTSMSSSQDHALEHAIESHTDAISSDHDNRSHDGSSHEGRREQTTDHISSPPPVGSLDAPPVLDNARQLDNIESKTNEQPQEEIRNIYERPPELARRLDLESRIEPRSRTSRYEHRSEPHLHPRNEHFRSETGRGRDSERSTHLPHAMADRPTISRPRLEDRMADGLRSEPRGVAVLDDRRPVPDRPSNAVFKLSTNGVSSPAERRPFSESRRFEEGRNSEGLHSKDEDPRGLDNDRRAPVQRRPSVSERRPVFVERRGPHAPAERRDLVDTRPANEANHLDDDARRRSLVEQHSHDLNSRPLSHSFDHRAPMLEERRPSLDGKRRVASPDAISATHSLSSPPGVIFARSRSMVPSSASNGQPSSPSPVAQISERPDTSIVRTPSLKERISDAPPLPARSEETGRTLPPRMAGSVHALEARNRTLSTTSPRGATDSRSQRPVEPEQDAPRSDRMPSSPERLSYPPQARPPPLDREDRRPPPPNEFRERRPDPPVERPRTMSYIRPESPVSRPRPATMARPRTPISATRPPPPPSLDYRRDTRPNIRPRTPELRHRSLERRPANYDRPPPPPPPPDRRVDVPRLETRGGPPPTVSHRRYEPPAPPRPVSPPPRERYPAEPPRREPQRPPVRAEYQGRPAYDTRAPLDTRPPPAPRPYDDRGRAPPARVAPEWEREPYRAAPAPAPIRDDRRMDIGRPRELERAAPPPPRDPFYPPGPKPATYDRPAPYLPPTPTSAAYPPYNEPRTRPRSRSPIDDRRPPLKRPRDDAYDYGREARDREYYAAPGPPPPVGVYERNRRTPPPSAVPYRR
ncbi:unnamed protein product [Peniophora sp. CBMAI 1063]|nr:unnamed protein product [Peniophora sp. CBMAI 1063]